MTIIGFLIVLVVVGVLLYLVNEYIPMQPNIKKILNIVVVVFIAILAVVFLLGLLGIDTGLRSPVLH